MSNDHIDDHQVSLEVRRLFTELEHNIKAINREKISDKTGGVSKDSFMNVAITVANLRANYLAKVISMQNKESLSDDDISSLRSTRTAFEEALEGYSALQHALKRQYLQLPDETA
ncbi:MAG: hypothetical protein JKY93_06105 [Gammaproteobacteria bacterium]|nr:hypothetical protein [Gammaproteobacteria bacterium]